MLAETGFPAARLELEVTESALVGTSPWRAGCLRRSRPLASSSRSTTSVPGYSSLRHLQQLPFGKLKIDQSFVGAMVADRESAKIVSAIVGLGHSLGLSTVA